MDSPDTQAVEHPEPTNNRVEQLHSVFGSYKAEWLQERIFDFFTAPEYLPELTTSRPCVLIGGRGTGKTTVLRGLSYEGQSALHGSAVEMTDSLPFYGLYYRIDSNKVSPFSGPELDHSGWIRVFGHYLNLVFSTIAIRFVRWFEERTRIRLLTEGDCQSISLSLHLPECSDAAELLKALTRSQVVFEAYINNVADAPRPSLSLQGAPLDLIFAALKQKEQLRGKQFFFLIDEYENLSDFQQEVVNTLIKHCGENYTFKIGVKELGWTSRSTLTGQRLVSPADYARVDITDRLKEGVFERFALQVCQSRLAHLQGFGVSRIEALLPSLSEEEEASRLGVVERNRILMGSRAVQDLSPQMKVQLETMSPLEQFVLLSLSNGRSKEIRNMLTHAAAGSREWANRMNNYGHALLFAIRKNKPGVRKFYAGWSVFTQIAGSNIRYLLQLVDQSIVLHFSKGNDTLESIAPEVQTLAAQEVGKKNLLELDGLAVEGADLTRLLLGLGRVFEVMAAEPVGHAPEVNNFRLAERPGQSNPEVRKLLDAAVMHLALVRAHGNKLGEHAQTRDFDYALHPIFAPFFVYSYRRKRKLVLGDEMILGLIKEQKRYIRDVLRDNHRVEETTLPEQAELFATYYG